MGEEEKNEDKKEYKSALGLVAEVGDLPKVELTKTFSPKPFAEAIMKNYQFRYDNHSRFWVYNKKTGLWLEDAEKFIKSYLRKYLFGDTQLKQNYTNEVTTHIRDVSWTREVPEDIDKNLIAFNNCLYDLNTDKIIEFSPEYFITRKANVDLDPNYTECPKMDKFFEELLKEDKPMLYDLLAYCLYREYPYQKLFILHGGGENGKSTYLDLLIHFIGKDNISSETPQELTTKDFSKGNLWTKYANVSSELPYRALTDTNTIKGLCGGDLIKCNRKFKEPFQFRSHAKLIFAGNELPATTDKTHAFARRLYIMKFLEKIKNPDRMYLQKIMTLEEMKGLAWVCKERLVKMKEKEWCFEIDVDPAEQLKIYEELSNPLSKFLKEEAEMDSDGFIFKYEFKDTFEAWCRQNGFRVWSDTELGLFMKNDYEQRKKSTVVDGVPKRYNAWVGLNWKKKEEKHEKEKETFSDLNHFPL